MPSNLRGMEDRGYSMVHEHARNPKNLSQGCLRYRDWCEVKRKIRERCPDIMP